MRTSALLLGALIGICSVPSALAEDASPAGRVELKCATVAPEGSTWMNILEKMDQDLYRKTRGRVRFKFYAGGIQGEERTVLDKIHFGQLQAGGFTGTGLGEIVPAVRILELPFLFRDYGEYDHVRAALAGDFDARFIEKGYTVLGWAEGGFANFFSSQEIGSLEDIAASRLWLRTGDPLLEVALREVASQPTPLPLSDVLTSLQTGLIDTVYVSPLASIALQWHPHLRYRLDLPVFNIAAALVVKSDALAAISDKDREALREVVAKHLADLVARTRADNEESIRVLESKGVSAVALDAASAQALEGLRDQIASKLVGRLFEQELLDRVHGLLAEYRANGR